MAAAKRTIAIDIVSDTVCPWCFVGKRRLEDAMKAFSDQADFKVRWHPYQLNPALPGGTGVDKMEMYKQKFGAERMAAILPRMKQVGGEHGIKFSYDGNIGNTFDSHRLIHYAEKNGKQDELVEELFHNYFEEEKCLSDHNVLLAAAKKVNLQGAESVLANPDAERAEVEAELAKFSKVAVQGVPQFIINGRPLPSSGAVEASELVSYFKRL